MLGLLQREIVAGAADFDRLSRFEISMNRSGTSSRFGVQQDAQTVFALVCRIACQRILPDQPGFDLHIHMRARFIGWQIIPRQLKPKDVCRGSLCLGNCHIQPW